MKFVLYTNCVSAHQLPFACEMVSHLGASEVAYVYENVTAAGSQCIDANAQWITTDKSVLQDCEILLVGGLRPISLMERRAQSGRKTYYMSERWFKPSLGVLRLAWPPYFKMARRFAKMLRRYDGLVYLPIGIHAARDMARLCGLMQGDLRCLFRAPRLEFERKPGGKIWASAGNEGTNIRYCLDKMRMWGYFVEKGRGEKEEEGGCNGDCRPLDVQSPLRVLWVGRMLKWKRVDTIILAVGELSRSPASSMPNSRAYGFILDIYGTGQEETSLKKLASKYGNAVRFYPAVAIDEVRMLMREHDVYVLSSNGYEGWGAVVSEALEEGMIVVGTHEAGSCATILPESCLFHAGDWMALEKLLCDNVPKIGIGEWTAKSAGTWMMRDVLGGEGRMLNRT